MAFGVEASWSQCTGLGKVGIGDFILQKSCNAATYNISPTQTNRSGTVGTGYVISFGIGASIVTLALWTLRYMRNVVYYNSFRQAYESLPSFHIQVMWLPGGVSGTLWSIGNFFSMISVQYLGEATGYSVIQAAMLVSGLWGIVYFREVTGFQTIFKWFLSAFTTVFGILLLSYEHHNG